MLNFDYDIVAVMPAYRSDFYTNRINAIDLVLARQGCQITAFLEPNRISVVKKTMKTKGKYKEKQRALLKVSLH